MKLKDQDNELLNIYNTSGLNGLLDFAISNNRLIAKQKSSRTKAGLVRAIKVIRPEGQSFYRDNFDKFSDLNSKYTTFEIDGFNYWIMNKIQAHGWKEFREICS